MLTANQSEQIAADCIRQATGFSGQIATSSVLNTIGVVDSDARDAVNDAIVTFSDIGVRHFGHELGPNDLTFTTTSKFFQLRDEISAKAVPTQENDAVETFTAKEILTDKRKKTPKLSLKAEQKKKSKSKTKEEKEK